MLSSRPSAQGAFFVGRTGSLALLYGSGAVLAGALLVYTWRGIGLHGHPPGPLLLQTAIPFLLALLLPVVGKRLSVVGEEQGLSTEVILREEARGTVIGGVSLLAVSGIILGLQGRGLGTAPGLVLTQMGTAGAIGGLLVGYTIASIKGTQRRLRERESRLRGLAHSLPGLVYQFEVRPDGSYTFPFVSEHAETVLGISAEPEGFFDRFVERVPEPHRQRLLASIEEAVAQNVPWRIELPFEKPSGERIWLEGRSIPERRNDRLVFHGVTLDITERIEGQRDARRRAEAMEVAADGMALLGPNGTYTYVNQAHAHIYGYEDRDAFLGNNWRMCYGDEELSRFETEVMPTLVEEGEWRGEAVGQRKDGSTFRQQLTLTTWGDGEIVCIVRDVSEEKKRSRQFKAIFNNTYQFTALLEPDGTLLEANQAVLNFGEVSRGEVVGKPVWETYWFRQGENTQQAVRRAVEQAANGEFVRREFKVQGADRLAVIDFSVRPVTDEDGAVTKLILEGRDITELKKKERALIEAKEEAERMNELKSAFLANMSHEIRTPLTSILGFAEMIREKAPSAEGGDGDLGRFAQLIGKSGSRLLDTLESVLDLSRLEAGEADLAPEQVDLVAEAADLAESFEPQAQSADVALRTDLPDEMLRVWADRQALRIVLRNLVSNAIKFTEAGGTVTVRVEEKEGRPAVAVEDTGIGMDPAQVSRLFEAFKQASSGVARSHEGSGLGLTVARDLTDQMDGTLTVDTEPEEGTCVTMALPSPEGAPDAPCTNDASTSGSPDDSPSTSGASSRCVLLQGDAASETRL